MRAPCCLDRVQPPPSPLVAKQIMFDTILLVLLGMLVAFVRDDSFLAYARRSMTGRIEVPFPPRPQEPRAGRIAPPWVPVTPRWEYRTVVRDLETEALPTAGDLDALGSDGWELSGVASEGSRVHFYFKRERTR